MTIVRTVEGDKHIDSFNRADDDSVGADYVEYSGDWDIVSNRAQVTNTSTRALRCTALSLEDVFIQAKAVNASLVTFEVFARFHENPGKAGYTARYDSIFGGFSIRRWFDGSAISIASTATGGIAGGSGMFQIKLETTAGLVEIKARFFNGVSWIELDTNDTLFPDSVISNVLLQVRSESGSRSMAYDSLFIFRKAKVKVTKVVGQFTPGYVGDWKAKLLNSSLASQTEGEAIAGVAEPDATDIDSSVGVPEAGFTRVLITDLSDNPLDYVDLATFPGDEFEWDGFPRFNAPTLTNQGTGSNLAVVGISAPSHPLGVTTADLFNEDNPLPYAAYAKYYVATQAAPTVVIKTVTDEAAVTNLQTVIDELAPGNYSITGLWNDGATGVDGFISAPLLVTVADLTEQPGDPLEGEITCSPELITLVIPPWSGPGTEVGIYWRMGRMVGVAFVGSSTYVDKTAGRHTRTIPMPEKGVRNGFRWQRIIDPGTGVWRLTAAETAFCDTPDWVAIPFPLNPSGEIFDDDFTLEWEFRGPVDFWTGVDHEIRVRHSSDLGLAWDVLEAGLVGSSLLIELGALATGWHTIELTRIEDDIEGASSYYFFRKGDPADQVKKDFKTMVALPPDMVKKWTGAGTGSDRLDVTHTPDVGLIMKRDTDSPRDFDEGVVIFEDFGEPLQIAGGAVHWSERDQNETGSISSRFASILFERFGPAFHIRGDGPDKTGWSGVLLERASNWAHGWPYSGNPRAPEGGSGAYAGINNEFNRINFGGAGPYVYGIVSDLRSRMYTKRTQLADPQGLGDASTVATTRWYPVNRVSGQHSYVYVFEVERIAGGWRHRHLIAGPNCPPTGWLVEDFEISETAGIGGAQAIPCGGCGLAYTNPLADGEVQVHSMIVSPELDCDCVPVANLPEIESVTRDVEARTITVVGNEPDSDEAGFLVRYQLYELGEYDTPIDDSDWIPWTEDGYVLGPVDPEIECLVVRYGWKDPCSTQYWAEPEQTRLPVA